MPAPRIIEIVDDAGNTYTLHCPTHGHQETHWAEFINSQGQRMRAGVVFLMVEDAPAPAPEPPVEEAAG